jgi:hypothetical protein
MTDRELRALRDANRDDGLLCSFANRIILARRNLRKIDDPGRRMIVQKMIARLEARLN